MQKSFRFQRKFRETIFAISTWGSRPESLVLMIMLTLFCMDGFRFWEKKYAKILQGFLQKIRETIFAIYLGIAARELGLYDHVNPLLMDGFRFWENKNAKIHQEFLRKFARNNFRYILGVSLLHGSFYRKRLPQQQRDRRIGERETSTH
jgi:hypothetical protein